MKVKCFVNGESPLNAPGANGNRNRYYFSPEKFCTLFYVME
jgi:hypothetical protein